MRPFSLFPSAVVVALLVAGPASGQRLPTADPASVGMSAERLEKIEYALQQVIQDGEIAGAVTVVVRDGKVVARDSAGVSALGDPTAMRTDAIFRIASMTKPITSVAVMMLVEEGVLSLNDRLSAFIPAFSEMRVATVDPDDGSVRYEPARREITIRDLLAHRSGLTYGFLDRGPVGDAYRAAGVSDGLGREQLTLAQNVDRLAAQPLVHQPGSAYQYGLSTDVLGRVVEVASGLPLDEYFRTMIFEPLGMADTHFNLPADRQPRLAGMHAREGGGPLQAAPTSQGSTLLSGGAGLFSTADDYARFLQMMLNGGELDGVRLLSPKTVELMTVSHTDDLPGMQGGGGREFGLGFAVVEDLGGTAQLGSVGSYNWGGIWGTTFWVDPAEDLVAVGMVQISGGAANFQGDFRTAVYQSIIESWEPDR